MTPVVPAAPLEGASHAPAPAHAQVHLREPLGERVLAEGLTLGGPGATVVLPGVPAGPALTLERRAGIWTLVTHSREPVERINGIPLEAARDLTRDDVVSIGDAQLIVTEVTRTLLHLSVCHLAGNTTVAPESALVSLPGSAPEDDLDIPAPPAAAVHRPRLLAHVSRRQRYALLAVSLALLALLTTLLLRLTAVPLDLAPSSARLHVNSWIGLRRGTHLWLLPGTYTVRAEAEGYHSASQRLTVNGRTSLRLHLAPLPGSVRVDTGGVPAVLSIDGAEVGPVPGRFEVAAGRHTFVLRAPRHLDAVTQLEVKGARIQQQLRITLQSSWGTLKISSVTPGAHVRVDGQERGPVPATVSMPSGVRDIQIFAPNRGSWRSSVVLKAGEVLSVGPIALGEPDARLTLTSIPSGAEVSVAGTHWGRTPAQIDLPAGVAHWVVLTLPGYSPWSQSVFADPGRKLTLEARLAPQWVSLTVRGEPLGAELRIDGTPRGHTPQTLRLPAVDHRIEVSAPGYLSFEGNLGAAAGVTRTLEYRLMGVEHVQSLMAHAATLTTGVGAVLQLVPPGAFPMGSPANEPGHRPNERLRRVSLARPFYLGVTEITNAQYREFRREHSSGSISGRSIDEAAQPVTSVSWEDAAAFCNWLSERDGLTPAYESRDGHWVLRRPATLGYRLPTEAEWEYAARYAGPGKFVRYAWGDAQTPPEGVGNLAGTETSRTLPASLSGYRDNFPVVAPVGQFHANALGLHDMAGNVSEWVNDFYTARQDPLPDSDPLGPDSGTSHVIRGPNWQSAQLPDLRLSWREGADAASPTLGFRIARYADF